MPDYIPGGDAEFSAWLDNFVTYANANLAAIGLVAADMTPTTTAQSTWKTAYPAHITASAAALSSAWWKFAIADDSPEFGAIHYPSALVRREQVRPVRPGCKPFPHRPGRIGRYDCAPAPAAHHPIADKRNCPMNPLVSRVLPIVCALVSLLALSDRAAAAVRPFSSSGTAQFVSPTDFVGAGHATYLGRYSEAGSVSFSPTGNPAVFHVDGSIVYTAANGDELHAVLTGELNGATGAITATVSYVGGTGRFANAGGSATLTGQLGAGGTISVTVSGTIDY